MTAALLLGCDVCDRLHAERDDEASLWQRAQDPSAWYLDYADEED